MNLLVRKITKIVLAIVVIAVILVFVFVFVLPNIGVQNPPSNVSTLKLVQTISLPNTAGRIDHMDINSAENQLYIATLGNNSLAIVNLNSGNLTGSITGLNSPQGVGYSVTSSRLYVSNAGDGKVNIYDSRFYTLVSSIQLQSDADNIRYDSGNNLFYIAYGQGGIAVIDASSGNQTGNIDLNGHPEGFQLEKNGSRIFVNIPSTGNYVTVVDRKTNSIVDKWQLTGVSDNFPMALDETHHRMFVAARSPATLVVLDTDSGKIVSTLGIAGDPDDVFYDPSNGFIYVSCGQGCISVIQQVSTDYYTIAASVSTSSSARTSFLDLNTNQYFVAVPSSLLKGAEILVYQITPIS